MKNNDAYYWVRVRVGVRVGVRVVVGGGITSVKASES